MQFSNKFSPPSTSNKPFRQPCILSKRWLHLWSTLPDLHFDFTGLAARDGVVLAGHPCTSQTFMHRFTHFITHFLSHRNHTSTIHKFHLSSSYLIDIDPEFVNQCVGYAASHGVRHLSLDVMCDYETPFAFPEAFFACKTLRVLKLRRNCSGIVVPKPFVLPCLVTLHLECFNFRDDHDLDDSSFSREPFSGLPDLEDLYLRQCRISGLIILAPKLQFLEISFDDVDTLTYHLGPYDVDRIWTPRLTSFRYEGHLPLECSNLEFPLVEEVFLNIFTHRLSFSRVVDRKMFLDSVGMLQQLGSAMFVTLSFDTLEVLEFDPHFVEERWSPFPNMKCLRLTEAAGTTKRRVVRPVMNYLTKECRWGDSMVVKLPEGVSVIEYEAASEEDDDGYDSDDMRLHCLFT